MKNIKDFRHRTAHNNFLRVTWTPVGLVIEGPPGTEASIKSRDGVQFAEEFAPPCSEAKWANPVPNWWKR